jgi:DNA polymerase III epsilon subunit-like protein
MVTYLPIKNNYIASMVYTQTMDELIFLDTETTGNDYLIDKLFQVCYAHQERMHSQYFKPPIPISIKSQAITHVTNKMVADKEPFATSPMRTELIHLLETHILVAHNAMFDVEILFREGVKTPRYICTLKVARFLDTEGIIPEYNLQYLRYFLDLDITADAHNAEDDVLVLQALFQRQYKHMMKEYGTHETVIEKMLEVSLQPSLFKVFTFGKHKGKKIADVVYEDRAYMEWILEKKLENGVLEDDWVFTLKYHLGSKK